VSVISDTTNRAVGSVSVGSEPQGVAYDPANGEVFVTNVVSNNVSVIDDTSNAVVASRPVGSNPQDVAYDTGQGTVYVANLLQGTVSILALGPAPSTKSATFLGLPVTEGYSVVSAIVVGVVVIAGVSVWHLRRRKPAAAPPPAPPPSSTEPPKPG